MKLFFAVLAIFGLNAMVDAALPSYVWTWGDFVCDWTWGVVLDAKNLGPVQYSGRRSSLTFKVADYDECAKKCYEHSECDSFNTNYGGDQCTLFKGAEVMHITHLRDVGKHSKMSGLCSRKGVWMKYQNITNKTCKNGRDITFKKINGDANWITCEWLCKKDPKCVEMAIVRNRWCHGCAKPLDQEYVPDRFGKSSVFKKETLP